MKLSIVQVGECPAKLRDRFDRYPSHFQNMFLGTGEEFSFSTICVLDGEPFPDPASLEGVVITGSAAGVYDTPDWINPLRQFVRTAYTAGTPTLGVCFGHQIMADALGGDVRKSEKGWGLGRNEYQVTKRPGWLGSIGDKIAIAASHQDQVMVPPADAEVFLSSEFTPNAGLIYRSGKAMSVQPHPEFDTTFSEALIELRRGNPLSDDQVDSASATLRQPLDSPQFAKAIARFFKQAA